MRGRTLAEQGQRAGNRAIDNISGDEHGHRRDTAMNTIMDAARSACRTGVPFETMGRFCVTGGRRGSYAGLR
jgi:hypothetical protein